MKSLIQIQQEAAEAIVALPEQGKRSAAYKLSLLNKRPDAIREIRLRFERDAKALGCCHGVEVGWLWQDVCEHAKLLADAACWERDDTPRH